MPLAFVHVYRVGQDISFGDENTRVHVSSGHYFFNGLASRKFIQDPSLIIIAMKLYWPSKSHCHPPGFPMSNVLFAHDVLPMGLISRRSDICTRYHLQYLPHVFSQYLLIQQRQP